MTSLPPSAPPAASPQLQRLGATAVDEVRKLVRRTLGELFFQFMGQMPEAVTNAAGKVPSPSERSKLTEFAKGIPSQAPRWVDVFTTRVDAQLIGGLADDADAPEGGDESVSTAAMELRAEDRYRKLVTELDARFNRIRLMVYVPVYTRALAPASLFRTLHEAADTLKWPPHLRGLLVERFDAYVVPKLEEVYRNLVEALLRIGNEVVKAAEPLPPKPAAPVIAEVAKAMTPPADTSRLDGETSSMLQSVARRSDGAGYHDGLLAADLLALNEGKPLPGIQKDQGRVPIQRIGLAGHFLNVAISDALLPQDARPDHESVRFPLMKSALTDPSLFTSTTHPLGTLIHEMLMKSAASRINGNRETKRMAELLEAVLVQFDLAPEFVRQAIQGAEQVEDSQIQRFFEFQRQQAQQRRDFVVSEAKRVVMRELEQSTFGRDLPAPALRFINSAWGPLLTRRLIRHGVEHASYQGALKQMEQLIDRLEARASQPPDAGWKALLEQVARALVAEGVTPDQARAQAHALHAAYALPLAHAI